MSYLDELDRELRRAGFSSGRRGRIVAEFADHLQSDPKADLGAPAQIADRFADELGTSYARTAAYGAFAALAFSGLVLVAMLAAGRFRSFAIYGQRGPRMPIWTTPALLVVALAAQIALAAGGLALLRAWQLRGLTVISTADAVVLTRRAAVGLGAGVITMLALPVAALSFPHAAVSGWNTAAWVVAGVSIAVLISAMPPVLKSARVRPTAAGERGDLRDDLAPIVPRTLTPTAIALLLAGAIVVLLTLAGVVSQDPYDGALRGLLDGAACLAGFAVLGGYLGLRSTPAAR